MKKCSRCGKDYSDDLETCPNDHSPPANPKVQQEAVPSGVEDFRPSSGLAFASLILGIVAVFSLGGGILAGVPAIICGHKALSKANKFPARYGGRGKAIAGLVMGYIMSSISLIVIIFLVLEFFH